MYTREEVIQGMRCGIKYFDKAQSLAGRAQVIDKAIQISEKMPTIWGEGWSNFAWAFGNAVIEILNPKGDISQSYNLDEVLTEQEIFYIKQTRQYSEDYQPLWNSKVLKQKKFNNI